MAVQVSWKGMKKRHRRCLSSRAEGGRMKVIDDCEVLVTGGIGHGQLLPDAQWEIHTTGDVWANAWQACKFCQWSVVGNLGSCSWRKRPQHMVAGGLGEGGKALSWTQFWGSGRARWRSLQGIYDTLPGGALRASVSHTSSCGRCDRTDTCMFLGLDVL